MKMGVTTLAFLMAFGTAEAYAQVDGRGAWRQGDARGGVDVETMMSMRDDLELSEEQLQALDELRAEGVAERSAWQAELAEMQSRLRAGQIPRSEMMAFLEARRESSSGVAQERLESVEAVLNEDQLRTVEELRARAQAFARGRASRGDGMRGDRFREGQRGFRPSDGRGPRGGNDLRRDGNDAPDLESR